MDAKTDVLIVGLGYIGLPTAAMLANAGLYVTGVDVNQRVVDTINAGQIHIVEPGLEDLVKKQVQEGRLRAVLDPTAAKTFMIAVPTPFDSSMAPDLSYVKSATTCVSKVLQKGDLVVLESTSPVGTTDLMLTWIKALRPDLFDNDVPLIYAAYCPERVLPGNVLHELVHNDRLIGGVNPESTQKAKAFYEQVVQAECVATNARTAEMAKLVENSFRDVNIAFANELSMLSKHFGVDVRELIALANRHPRVNILQPGCGVGGHCIAVDPWFLVDGAPHLAKLIKTARNVNDSKPDWVVEQVDTAISQYLRENPTRSLNQLRIAIYGLSFKPDIDDLRESPALDIATQIAQRYRYAKLSVVEPHIQDLPNALIAQGVDQVSLADAAEYDIKVVLVAHSLFKKNQTHFTGTVINVAW